MVINPNIGKYWPEITPYLDTFDALKIVRSHNNSVFLLNIAAPAFCGFVRTKLMVEH